MLSGATTEKIQDILSAAIQTQSASRYKVGAQGRGCAMPTHRSLVWHGYGMA